MTRPPCNNASYLFDVTRLVWRRWEGRQSTGIDRVCLAYLDHFAADAQAVVQHRRVRRILDCHASAALFELLARPPSDFRAALIRFALRFGARRGCLGRGRVYLNIGHTGLDDPQFTAWVRGAGVRPVYFVHDLIPLTHPQFCRPGEQDKHGARVHTVLTTGAGVIANSRATLHELAAFAARHSLPHPPAVRALLGSDALTICQPPGVALRPTFVVLGTIEARKNHLMLLQLWARIIERLGRQAPHLLILGQRGWECDDVFDLLDRSETLGSAVTEIGRCDDATLASHLAGARALLFPSLVEGYGLPLVEALRAGTPVIASDLPVFRELAGDIPDYLDPHDDAAWELTILSYASDASTARDAQLERLKAFHAPDWKSHFATVDPWLAAL